MVPFAYAVAPSVQAAMARVALTPNAEFIAGGTDMLQLLQEGVRAPEEIIDLNGLPLTDIEVSPNGVRIGALARMAQVADDPRIHEQFPVVTQALLASASPQVRNMATIGGNLLQRTRCLYYRDVATPCNKRDPGSGCSALDGENRMSAVLGGSSQCIAAYPGDLAVALLVVDAEAQIAGLNGQHTMPIEKLHRTPGETPHIETNLQAGEIITAVLIPISGYAKRSCYLKLRDRASFEWAVASAAVALEMEDGKIRQARVAVGGVATKPWRLHQVEQILIGEKFQADLIRRAASLAAAGAEPRKRNAFKVELLKRVVERALRTVGGET